MCWRRSLEDEDCWGLIYRSSPSSRHLGLWIAGPRLQHKGDLSRLLSRLPPLLPRWPDLLLTEYSRDGNNYFHIWLDSWESGLVTNLHFEEWFLCDKRWKDNVFLVPLILSNLRSLHICFGIFWKYFECPVNISHYMFYHELALSHGGPSLSSLRKTVPPRLEDLCHSCQTHFIWKPFFPQNTLCTM